VESLWDVLVVDDEEVVCEAVARVLSEAGYRVAAASSAAAAVSSPALATCRLVLLDLMLPDRSGLSLLETLRRLDPRRPVVVITGYGTADSLARALERGAAGVLPKPFDAEELLRTVRTALGEEAPAGPNGGSP